MRRPAPPPLDPARLERIRSRVLVTVAASGLAAVGCDHTPEHTINRPAIVHPPAPDAVHPPAPPPSTPGFGEGAERVGTVNTPFRPPTPDAGAPPPPVVRPPPENLPLPIPTANPPAPVRPRMPPGNG